MSVLDHVRLMVYRIHEKGLEVLMPNEGTCIIGSAEQLLSESEGDAILLEGGVDEEGQPITILAVEGDWHDIPSIRKLIRSDVDFVKDKIMEIVPEIENGVYVAIKEAFKKTLPHEYKALKELKEVIVDRNLVKNI
ncbi:MAG: hypothetical protein R3275_00250 [Saprospiraceae bacterium]|nr:hypothetical protein [Saprospiraceae bacterium]